MSDQNSDKWVKLTNQVDFISKLYLKGVDLILKKRNLKLREAANSRDREAVEQIRFKLDSLTDKQDDTR